MSSRFAATVAALALALSACGGDEGSEDETASEPAAESSEDAGAAEGGEGGDTGSGEVVAAGSSTVLPVAEIIIEEFSGQFADINATYDSIGSGGGFERLCSAGDVDVSGASRAIKDEEADLCAENGIEFIELQFANDALTMVTSPETDWVECLTNEQVVQIFGPDAASTWDEVVDGAPSEPIDIYAPDTDSGTYGFMVEDVMGLEESTQDYSASADDNVIVQGIESGAGTWGFFGLAYFTANEGELKALEYDGGDGCVAPSVETAESGEYGMTRPLFIYVNVESLTSKPQVQTFVDYFLENATTAVEFEGYIPSQDALDESTSEVADAVG